MGKKEKVKNNSQLQNEAIRGLQIGAREITNRGSIGTGISNEGKRNFSSGQGLQIGAEQ